MIIVLVNMFSYSGLGYKYLASEPTLLYDVHADVEDVFHQLIGIAEVLIFGGSQDSFSQDFHIPCLDCNTDDMSVRSEVVAGLKNGLDDLVKVLLSR